MFISVIAWNVIAAWMLLPYAAGWGEFGLMWWLCLNWPLSAYAQGIPYPNGVYFALVSLLNSLLYGMVMAWVFRKEARRRRVLMFAVRKGVGLFLFGAVVVSWNAVSFLPVLLFGRDWGYVWYSLNLPLSVSMHTVFGLRDEGIPSLHMLIVSELNAVILGLLAVAVLSVIRRFAGRSS